MSGAMVATVRPAGQARAAICRRGRETDRDVRRPVPLLLTVKKVFDEETPAQSNPEESYQAKAGDRLVNGSGAAPSGLGDVNSNWPHCDGGRPVGSKPSGAGQWA